MGKSQTEAYCSEAILTVGCLENSDPLGVSNSDPKNSDPKKTRKLKP